MEQRKNKRLLGFFLFIVLTVVLTGGLYAQTEYDFPAGDFWALNFGLGWGGMMEYGSSFFMVIDPRLWLSPQLMVGVRAGLYYSFEGNGPHPDPDATSDTLYLDGQVYLRWNFLRLGENVNRKINIFAQGGIGLVAAYRGDKNPFDDKTKRRGSILFDGGLGATFPITDRWHLEGIVHGGFPHMFSITLTAGYKFPLPQKTRSRTEYIREEIITEREILVNVPPIEIVKFIHIRAIEFIIFGPDIASYNIGVDRNGQSLNDMVINATAQMLRDNPQYIVRLEGNANPVTDDPREAEELYALSFMRASTVARELERRGVPREQMHIMAYGGTRTITSEYSGWDRNRRVELIIMHAETGAE